MQTGHFNTAEAIIQALESEGEERLSLFAQAAKVKEQHVGNVVYFRGLIEYSNICAKNCYYCGIRRGNRMVKRYTIAENEVLAAAEFAFKNGYGSVVLQSGEQYSRSFINTITRLVSGIKKLSGGALGITLSCGEQTNETYRSWFQAGAHRYLLRVESADEGFYSSLHPNDKLHQYQRRLQCLADLKEIGYQVGTGVMIGLPGQTTAQMANDLLFMKQIDVDMVGMGPYIEHQQTPLTQKSHLLLPLQQRFDYALKMIAILRIIMPDINIAAATAMQAIDKLGREKAVKAGANIIMPNITPGAFRDEYNLYENKPCTDDSAEDCKTCLEARVGITDHTIGYGQWGDSLHFRNRQKNAAS